MPQKAVAPPPRSWGRGSVKQLSDRFQLWQHIDRDMKFIPQGVEHAATLRDFSGVE
jgi:hypothetical protein